MNRSLSFRLWRFAAYACILLLHRRHDFYPRLESVVVYPDVYPVPVTRQGPGNTVIETNEVRAGESWPTGTVVISWNHLRHRPADPVGGHNVALHGLAHQLDQENGPADGAPELGRSSQYRTWARVLGREYETLSADAEADRPSLLDKYGATNPAEFFPLSPNPSSSSPTNSSLGTRHCMPSCRSSIGKTRKVPAGRLEFGAEVCPRFLVTHAKRHGDLTESNGILVSDVLKSSPDET